MPYIEKERREALDEVIYALPTSLNLDELNYIITKILLCTYPQSYFEYCTLIGTLECVKQEFYRRMVAPYEDGKMKEHGDVY